MDREILDYLKDILDAMEKSQKFVENISYAQFTQDDKTVFAVIRALEIRSEEHTSELQSHSFISYAVFCLKKKKSTLY